MSPPNAGEEDRDKLERDGNRPRRCSLTDRSGGTVMKYAGERAFAGQKEKNPVSTERREEKGQGQSRTGSGNLPLSHNEHKKPGGAAGFHSKERRFKPFRDRVKKRKIRGRASAPGVGRKKASCGERAITIERLVCLRERKQWRDIRRKKGVPPKCNAFSANG